MECERKKATVEQLSNDINNLLEEIEGHLNNANTVGKTICNETEYVLYKPGFEHNINVGNQTTSSFMVDLYRNTCEIFSLIKNQEENEIIGSTKNKNGYSNLCMLLSKSDKEMSVTEEAQSHLDTLENGIEDAKMSIKALRYLSSTITKITSSPDSPEASELLRLNSHGSDLSSEFSFMKMNNAVVATSSPLIKVSVYSNN